MNRRTTETLLSNGLAIAVAEIGLMLYLYNFRFFHEKVNNHVD